MTLAFTILAIMRNGQWYPANGDPSPMGTVTVVAYVLVGLLCGLCALLVQRRSPSQSFEIGCWSFIALLLLAFAVNKQFDLQSWFTSVGRDLARGEGWYAHRTGLQLFGMMAILTGGIWGLRRIDWQLKKRARSAWPAFIGLAYLSSFIVIRAASFHQVDRLIGWQLFGIRMNWVLELGGIAAIAAGAILAMLNITQGKTR